MFFGHQCFSTPHGAFSTFYRRFYLKMGRVLFEVSWPIRDVPKGDI